ncbi:MAG TPA: class II aldolase/adducin family protein [Tepidisphaeraceae bacterium]|jgi:L-fuculose-phosphate aldolase|nr:class II aldolase/adducin family protein [Tepidisphaeraceae bacterium]
MAYIPNNAPRVSEFRLKEQMCDVGRRIWLKGFCAGNEGNHSYRLGEDRILCTPSLISKGNLKPDDMCVVDMKGKQISGKRKRTSEILLHLAIYSERPDVKAVIHSHPPHATAFAVAGVDLPTCIHPEAEVFLGPVKTAKYVTPGDTRLGESIKPFIKESNTILLGNHGVVCYGPDLEDAYYKLEIVDAYSRILLLTKQLGSIRPLEGDEMKELLALKSKFGMFDPRTAPGAGPEKMACSGNDFVSRVRAQIGERGRMSTGGGTAPVQPQGSSMERAIGSMIPSNYSEDDIEQLVQSITDQIMATAG